MRMYLQAMLDNLKLPLNQQDYLRFYWCKDHSYDYDTNLQYSSEKSYMKPIGSHAGNLEAKIGQMWLANIDAIEPINSL